MITALLVVLSILNLYVACLHIARIEKESRKTKFKLNSYKIHEKINTEKK